MSCVLPMPFAWIELFALGAAFIGGGGSTLASVVAIASLMTYVASFAISIVWYTVLLAPLGLVPVALGFGGLLYAVIGVLGGLGMLAFSVRVLKNRALLASIFLFVVLGFGLYGGVIIFPLFTQTILGFSPTQTGWAMMPGGLATAAMAVLLGGHGPQADRPQPHGDESSGLHGVPPSMPAAARSGAATFTTGFTAISDLSVLVDIHFTRARSNRDVRRPRGRDRDVPAAGIGERDPAGNIQQIIIGRNMVREARG